MLHVGQNNCKYFSCKSKIGGRAFKRRDIYTKLYTNSESEQLLWARTASHGPEGALHYALPKATVHFCTLISCPNKLVAKEA